MVRGPTIRCILFDLGSTLWTYREETAFLAERQAQILAGGMLRNAIGRELFSSMDHMALGALLQQAIDEHMRAVSRQRPGYEPDYALVTRRALHQLGLGDVDRAHAEALYEALRVRIPVSRILFPDTLSTLAALKERGYLVGVVTNRHYGGPLFREDVATMGLLDYFKYEHMAISADLGVCKPHPAIFLHALNSLNVSPKEVAMVGDSLEADIAGAMALHLLTIWKHASTLSAEKSRALSAIEPHREIQQLSQLLEMF
ncbi:MAG TPA: HAD-IA family hydrolase [Ktedonobacteraceae bacterium]|jgi:HAD superfamily hydrolase (TIGR01509 family)